MTYELTEEDAGTRVTFIQEDPRESGGSRNDDDEEVNPVLLALRDVAEAITSQ